MKRRVISGALREFHSPQWGIAKRPDARELIT